QFLCEMLISPSAGTRRKHHGQTYPDRACQRPGADRLPHDPDPNGNLLGTPGRERPAGEHHPHLPPQLLWFYQELPPDKRMTRSTLSQWSAALLERGYTTRTVNAALTAVNGFLDFWDLREYQLANRLKLPADQSPLSLSRREYLALL